MMKYFYIWYPSTIHFLLCNPIHLSFLSMNFTSLYIVGIYLPLYLLPNHPFIEGKRLEILYLNFSSIKTEIMRIPVTTTIHPPVSGPE